MELRLFPDYFCYCLWMTSQDGTIHNINGESLSLSTELLSALRAWEAQYDNTFNADYPPTSAFSSFDDEQRFWLEGERLYLQLKNTLPQTITLVYSPH